MGFIQNFLDKRRKTKMRVELQRQTELLTRKDIGMWRMAWQRALNVQNPNRNMLYDIYNDTIIDAHVSGCINQRKNMAMKGYCFLTKNGQTDEKATKLIQAEWFQKFMSLVLDSVYYGHSLIEFGDVVGEGDLKHFEYVNVIPRRHVIPEYSVIVKHIGDQPNQGIDYNNGKIADWLIEVGDSHDLGLLLKVAPHAISKKNMISFWDGFGEIFGMPIRIAKTTSRDEQERGALMNMLSTMGSAFYGVFPEGTEMEVINNGSNDAYNVFDRKIDRDNSEISKCILGETMTTDSGASYSQSETHLTVLQDIIANDKQLIANVVTNKLIPLMAKHGFDVEGCEFNWDETEHYSSEDMRNVEQMLLQNGYDIDPNYFVEKYAIPVTGRSNPALMSAKLAKGDVDFFL